MIMMMMMNTMMVVMAMAMIYSRELGDHDDDDEYDDGRDGDGVDYVKKLQSNWIVKLCFCQLINCH